MPARKDLIGQHFGRLTVLLLDSIKTKRGATYWYCRCVCGKHKSVERRHLITGRTKSCGCLVAEPRKNTRRYRDITGQTFGKLTALRRVGTIKRKSVWVCKCQCGNETTGSLDNLTNGHKKSCGCMVAESNKATSIKRVKHGKSILRNGKRDRTYTAWQGMIQRCTNQRHIAYDYYGGRGIFVCSEWKYSFERFLADMGESKPGYTLERKDVNGCYCASNCLWIPKSLQSRNMRSTKLTQVKANRIREFASIGIPKTNLAESFGVTVGHIAHIVNHRYWV